MSVSAGAQPPIRVSGVVLRDGAGRMLTVRKRGTARFMLPGGKPEPGEDARQAAVRECAEEVGLVLAEDDIVLLGRFDAAAANEPGRTVASTVFVGPQVAPAGLSAHAEIAELRWLDLAPGPSGETATLPDDLAPLLREHVVPALLAAGQRR